MSIRLKRQAVIKKSITDEYYSPLRKDVLRLLKFLVKLSGITVFSIGAIVLIGWILNYELLKSIITTLPSMKANTAIAFLFAGISVWLTQVSEKHKILWYLQKLSASIVVLIGVLTLFQYIIGQSIGIDELFFREAPGALGTAFPNRMAPNSALIFSLCGVALLFLERRILNICSYHLFGIPAAIVLLPTLIGYIYGIEFIYGVASATKMAIPTALAFFLLISGILAARPMHGFTSVIVQDDAGGYLARRLFFTGVLIPFSLGWLVLNGHKMGWYDHNFKFLLLVGSCVIVFTLLIWRNALSLSVADRSRKKAEAFLSRIAAIVESSDDAIIGINTKGVIMSWNKGAEHLYKYTEEEVLGKRISFLIPKNKRNDFPQIMKKLLKGERVEQYETKRLKKNGEAIDIILTVSPIKNSTGKIIGASKIARDITDRKSLERQKDETLSLLELILNRAPVGIFRTDADGNCVYMNKRWSVYAGLSMNGAYGTGWSKALHPEDRDRVFMEWERAVKQKKEFMSEYRFRTSSGKVTILQGNAVSMVNKNRKIMGYLGTIMDITQLKELEKQKDEFLAIASHELKTPVTSIKAYGQVLQTVFRRKSDMSAVEQLQKMDAQINKLTNLIGDLLDVTKIQSGRLEFHEDLFDFNELVREIGNEMQLTTEKHKIIIELDKSINVFGDRDRIGQVLTNLISNAIKYSPQSDKIIIKTAIDKDRVTVCVKDFGVGISKENQNKVFEQFFRVSGPSNITVPGLGLGLYISSEIIRRQNGKIWVESSSGNGSVFCFSLPLHNKKIKSNKK